MARNMQLETEMQAISNEVWAHFKTTKAMPAIESKQGGSSGCYYPSRHTVYYRWNVWNKLTLAGKRLLAIHELYHAAGFNHDSTKLFLHAFDILTLELYARIYGEDSEITGLKYDIKNLVVNQIIK